MTMESNGGHEAMNTRQATGLHLRQLINLLRRRWKLIIAAVGVAVGLAGTIWLSFPPRYTATAQFIVDPPRGSSGAGEPSIAGVLDDAAVQTHVAALLSQSHLQRVFDSIVAERGPGPKEKRSVLGAQEFSIETFTDRINAFRDTRSRMIGITYTSTDPAFAAAVANWSVELYLATLTERNLADRSDALRSLSKRIPLVRAEVVRADAALQSYRIKHGFTEASRMDMVDQQLVDLNHQLAVARSDLAERHARPTALRIDQTTNQSQLAEESSAIETRLQQLERRIAILQDASTEVREPEARLRALQREATAFVQLHDGLVQRQKAILEGGNVQPDVRVLSSASIPTLPSSLNPLLFIPPAMVLALIGAGLLAILLDQLDAALRSERDVTDALGISCIGVIPQLTRCTGVGRPVALPVWRRGVANIWRFGFWFRQCRQHRFSRFLLNRSGSRLVQWFWLRRLWHVTGRIEGRRMPRPHQLIPQDARYTEAIRSVVAAALQLANPQKSPKTFLVTSSVPGEGKTTLAISFAIYAARIQRRVLLIDLAFRHPSIACELGGPADGGILHVLQGRPLAELIRTAPGLGFDYLPLSRDSADPVAALASEGVPKLLRQLEGSYDCVVIDSEPLLSATAARLLASKVDKVLFAVKWGSTPREVAQNALRLLRRSAFGGDDPQDAITAVITQVDLERHARYRYGDLCENLLHVKPHPA
jgi:succinoglycan biosynthesis transport protein ExoP